MHKICFGKIWERQAVSLSLTTRTKTTDFVKNQWFFVFFGNLKAFSKLHWLSLFHQVECLLGDWMEEIKNQIDIDDELDTVIADDEPLLGQISFDELFAELRIGWSHFSLIASSIHKHLYPWRLAFRGLCFLWAKEKVALRTERILYGANGWSISNIWFSSASEVLL